eukprot:scaffold134322_cov26-Prasinocladus_malaysianus.AAC.1
MVGRPGIALRGINMSCNHKEYLRPLWMVLSLHALHTSLSFMVHIQLLEVGERLHCAFNFQGDTFFAREDGFAHPQTNAARYRTGIFPANVLA